MLASSCRACLTRSKCTSPSHALLRDCLHDRLELAGVAERVLDDHLAEVLLLAVLVDGLAGVGEVDVAVADDPAAGLGELDDGALRVEEEEGLGAVDGQAGVCALGGGGDLGADLGGEDLRGGFSSVYRKEAFRPRRNGGRNAPQRRRRTPRKGPRGSSWPSRRGRSCPP